MQQHGTSPITALKHQSKWLRDPTLADACVLTCSDHATTLWANISKILFETPRFLHFLLIIPHLSQQKLPFVKLKDANKISPTLRPVILGHLTLNPIMLNAGTPNSRTTITNTSNPGAHNPERSNS